MHGVKRLFAWMIPRFDADAFEVSLVSLRKRDLSEETLDALGIDITYLHKSQFDPATITALLKVVDRQQIDVLHLHGYGATTFGRIAAALRGIPAILHEHANLTDTPWFQKLADRLLEPYTDIAIAVSQSTAEFVINARRVQPRESEGRLSRSAARGVQPSASGGGTRIDPGAARDRARRPRRRHRHAAARFEGKCVPRRCRQAGARSPAGGEVLSRRGRPAAPVPGRAGDPAGPRRPLRVRRVRARHRGRARGLRHQRLPLVVGGDTADRVRGPGRRQADRRHRRRRTPRRAHAGYDAEMVPRRDAQALADAIVHLADRPQERARLSAAARTTSERFDIGAFVRKMERLYRLLHDSRRAPRGAVLRSDLSFLT